MEKKEPQASRNSHSIPFEKLDSIIQNYQQQHPKASESTFSEAFDELVHWKKTNPLRISHTLCARCNTGASIQCSTCEKNYCGTCHEEAHQGPQKTSHVLSAIQLNEAQTPFKSPTLEKRELEDSYGSFSSISE